MPEQIISASGTQYGMVVNPNGTVGVSGLININNISGSIMIGSVSASVDSIYVQSGDNIHLSESVPTDTNMNNPAWSFIYDTTGNMGSIYQMIGIGSYVNVITWAGYSGTSLGIGSRVTNIGSWSIV